MLLNNEQWSAYFWATLMTIELTLSAIFIGLIIGLLLALARISKNQLASKLSGLYIWLFRGTPLLLQIFIIYFSLPAIGIKLNAFVSAVIAFGLNSGAYLAEIIRAALLSIGKGQMEAAKALGMTDRQAMFKIIIPQSYRRLVPPIGNEFIMLLKESSLVSVIGIVELLKTAKTMTNSHGGHMLYYIIAAAIYLFLTSFLSYIFHKLERKYSVYE